MIEHRPLKHTRFACTLLGFALAATPAFAVNKDMVQLQTQVQDLQTAVAHLQQSNDERMGVLRDLVQQNADSVNRMTTIVEALQKQVQKQEETSGAKLDQVSGQVQSLNDSLDEVKARLNGMEKALQSVQSQQQSINATLQNMAPPAGSQPGSTPGAAPGANPGGPSASDLPAAQPTVADGGRPSADIPFAATQGPPRLPQQNAAAGPPSQAVSTLYNTALKDYMAAKYSLATSEFQQVTTTYPSDSFAGNAFYYLGEIDYRQGKFAEAVKDYDQVLNQYPSNPKIPVSHLHKAQALLALKQRDAGINEFRALIQRFPTSPEAAQARTRLNGMGVPVAGKRPS
jgi:tol-pal system protein YbgF